MKKRHCIILTVCICLLLCGCLESQVNYSPDPEKTFTLYQLGNDDGLATNSSVNYIPNWKDMFQDDDTSPESSIQVLFNGTVYEGEWRRSSYTQGNNYRTDYYKYDNGTFGIDSRTKEMVEIVFFYDDISSTISIAEAENIARSVAEQYIDTSYYDLVVDDNTNLEYNPAAFPDYIFTWDRWINGVKCWDNLRVVITTDGRVQLFCQYMTSEFQEFVSHSKEEDLNEIVEELNSKTVREMIENTIKMNCRYPDQLGSIDIQDPLLVLLPGDQLGAIYTVFSYYGNNITQNRHTFLVMQEVLP